MQRKYVLEATEYSGVYYTGLTTSTGVAEMTNNIYNAAMYCDIETAEGVRSILANHNKPLHIREILITINIGRLFE